MRLPHILHDGGEVDSHDPGGQVVPVDSVQDQVTLGGEVPVVSARLHHLEVAVMDQHLGAALGVATLLDRAVPVASLVEPVLEAVLELGVAQAQAPPGDECRGDGVFREGRGDHFAEEGFTFALQIYHEAEQE